MKYVWESDSQRYETDDLSSLEQMLHEEPLPNEVIIHINLPIPLGAIVRRDGIGGEIVIMMSDASARSFVRATYHTRNNQGTIGVSCSPQGSEVVVQSINLPFRDCHDEITDRGAVWVIPGQPAIAKVILYPHHIRTSNEKISVIISAAEAVVRDRVLRHFAN